MKSATPGGGAIEIKLEQVGKRYPSGTEALAPVDLRVRQGEFVAIVGPSGCGKSTLLRILAGLIAPSSGRAHRPKAMTSAFVFQEPALLPWKTVQANAELLMKLERRHDPKTRAWEASEALRLVGLGGFERSYPHELSGGMRMRLSLARAIALKPDLLLLDEPLAAVDELTRDTLQEELARLRRLVGFAAVLVTHNVQEAAYLADRVIVMSARPGR